jgi:hypothetical protein
LDLLFAGLFWFALLGAPDGCKFSKGFWGGGRQAQKAMRCGDIAMRQMDSGLVLDWSWSRICIFCIF